MLRRNISLFSILIISLFSCWSYATIIDRVMPFRVADIDASMSLLLRRCFDIICCIIISILMCDVCFRLADYWLLIFSSCRYFDFFIFLRLPSLMIVFIFRHFRRRMEGRSSLFFHGCEDAFLFFQILSLSMMCTPRRLYFLISIMWNIFFFFFITPPHFIDYADYYDEARLLSSLSPSPFRFFISLFWFSFFISLDLFSYFDIFRLLRQLIFRCWCADWFSSLFFFSASIFSYEILFSDDAAKMMPEIFHWWWYWDIIFFSWLMLSLIKIIFFSSIVLIISLFFSMLFLVFLLIDFSFAFLMTFSMALFSFAGMLSLIFFDFSFRWCTRPSSLSFHFWFLINLRLMTFRLISSYITDFDFLRFDIDFFHFDFISFSIIIDYFLFDCRERNIDALFFSAITAIFSLLLLLFFVSDTSMLMIDTWCEPFSLHFIIFWCIFIECRFPLIII